eukprot:m.82106 g.82106  ORF g.82106 m.82106 type:complete len:650 (-) comp14281_c0_seq1:114-2063(-)
MSGHHDDDMEFASEQLKALVKENAKLKYQLQHLRRNIDEASKPSVFKLDDKPGSGIDVMAAVTELMTSTIRVAYPQFGDVDPSITIPAAKVKNAGSYQCNAAMNITNLLKKEGTNLPPREVAQHIANSLPENPVIDQLEVAGPGFINVHVKKQFVQAQIEKMLREGVLPPSLPKKKVIVDFSSPNIAKEMHVGHLRSTIIGESLCRVLEFCGHETLRVNHVGDWGTQFGMLIAHLKREFPDYKTKSPPIGDLQAFYKASKARFDKEPEFKKAAYNETVKLQSGDEDVTLAWKLICDVSRKEFQEIYDRLDVTIEEKGESFYQSRMQAVVEELTQKGLLVDDVDNPGRIIAWTSAKDQTNIPLIVVKSDGAFTYDTSDLATLRYRAVEEKADWIVYVVGQSQDIHFKNVFALGRDAGWVTSDCRIDHAGFGDVLGEDGKKFKTRSGETVRLKDLLDEGITRARQTLEKRNRSGELSGEEEQKVYEAVAYGCIKYADLSQVRTNEYEFSYDKMLNDKGNTAVYLLYAYTRIQSILRQPVIAEHGIDLDKEAQTRHIAIEHEREVKLTLMLMRFPEIVTRVLKDLSPKNLCDYIYELSTTFTSFYDKCYCVRKDKTGKVVEVNVDRLLLVRATGIVMQQVLSLLGIRTIDRM